MDFLLKHQSSDYHNLRTRLTYVTNQMCWAHYYKQTIEVKNTVNFTALHLTTQHTHSRYIKAVFLWDEISYWEFLKVNSYCWVCTK